MFGCLKLARLNHMAWRNSSLADCFLLSFLSHMIISWKINKNIVSVQHCWMFQCWGENKLLFSFSYLFLLVAETKWKESEAREWEKLRDERMFSAAWSLLLLLCETDSSIKDINSQASGSFIVLNFKRHLRSFRVHFFKKKFSLCKFK